MVGGGKTFRGKSGRGMAGTSKKSLGWLYIRSGLGGGGQRLVGEKKIRTFLVTTFSHK